ncbi:MAG TPA: hypothetical protein VIR98_03025 [Candidatus Paceibacterota bacterium]
MNQKLSTAKKILIIGDSGRGKSTFARRLTEKTGLPLHSTDDYFWKIKFTVPNDRQESIEKIERVYESDAWIVEGSTTHLIKPGLEKSDIILNLVFRNIFEQWWSLICRNWNRDNEKLFSHLIYVARKRFGIGNDKEKKKKELLKQYEQKIITIDSYKKLDQFLV